jgi:hypothetical protein
MTTVLTTDQEGAIAETAIIHAAVELGIDVYVPVVEGGRYDLILDLRSRLVRVQVKWASRDGDVVRVRCYSCRRTKTGLLKRADSASEIDAIAAYCADLDRCLYFPMTWLDGRAFVQLRERPTRNNQRHGVNWLDDFAFERLAFESQGP